ncbi:MAG: DNA repair exonuclease [Candidatus Aenigmarchaeota archaeon]|nr:DNA repair exonuclease [Candidatus Aenigmarchaeota archaeon]
MKIAVLSDLHFGYAYNSELENDCFDNAEEAMEKALDSDLIILAGDIFDIRAPKTQTWGNALRILSKPVMKDNPGIKLVQADKQMKEISKRILNHIPVVAITGNHERLAKGEINTVESLENAGLAIQLHLNTIVFEKDGKKVAIHGMSSVPERYAKDVLDKWNPQPLPDCVNILLMHQSIDPYIYSPIEPPTISLSNLPKGFDVIVNGHLHGHNMEKIDGTMLVMPGSTVITQLEKNEAQVGKAITKITIEDKVSCEFIPLETNRKFYYEELLIGKGVTVTEQLERKINQVLFSADHKKRPLIRLKVTGNEINVLDQDLREMERKYSDKAILIFAKQFETQELSEKMELLRNMREQKMSVEDLGLSLLKKNMEEMGGDNEFDYETTFSLLSNGQVDSAFNILLGQQTTLNQIKARL